MRHFSNPSRGGQGLDFATYNNMVQQSRKLSNIKFDPQMFSVQEDPTGIYVSGTPSQANGSSFTHHFQVLANAASNNVSFDIAAGDWIRNGEAASWSVGSVNPVTENIMTAAFSGNVYAYAVRMDSQGGNDALKIIAAGGAIEGNNQFKNEELIASIQYYNGKIKSIDQSLVGDICDVIPMGSGLEQFGIKVTRYGTDSMDVKFTVSGGDVSRRDKAFIAANVASVTSTTITTDKVVFLDLGYESTTGDVSLIPQIAEIKIEDTWPSPTETGYTNRWIPLYTVRHLEGSIKGSADGSTGKIYHSIAVVRHHYGTIKDDWVRPDGQNTGNSVLDDVRPRAKTLDFVPATASSNVFAGTLEDYNFFKQVVDNDATVFGTDGDVGIAYYDVEVTAPPQLTTKQYARVDSANAADHGDAGKSIEIKSHVLQLQDFFTTAGDSILDATTESPSPYLFLVRDSTVTTPILNYVDISEMKVADAYHADEADICNLANVANIAYVSNMYYSNTSGYSETSNVCNYISNAYTISHTALNFTGATQGSAHLNTDHDFDYWNMGGTYEYCHGASIGRSTTRDHDPSSATNPMAIDLQNSRLMGDTGSYIALDWVNKICYSNSGSKSIAWDAFQLCNYGSGDKTVDWTAMQLWSTSPAFATVDWGLSLLRSNSATGGTTVNWQNCTLVSPDGYASLCWDISGFPATNWYINLGNNNQWRPDNFDVYVNDHANVTSDTIYLDAITGALDLTGQGVNITVQGGQDLKVDGNIGKTISNWSTRGVLTESTLIEKTVWVSLSNGGACNTEIRVLVRP